MQYRAAPKRRREAHEVLGNSATWCVLERDRWRKRLPINQRQRTCRRPTAVMSRRCVAIYSKLTSRREGNLVVWISQEQINSFKSKMILGNGSKLPACRTQYSVLRHLSPPMDRLTLFPGRRRCKCFFADQKYAAPVKSSARYRQKYLSCSPTDWQPPDLVDAAARFNIWLRGASMSAVAIGIHAVIVFLGWFSCPMVVMVPAHRSPVVLSTPSRERERMWRAFRKRYLTCRYAVRSFASTMPTWHQPFGSRKSCCCAWQCC